MLPAGDQDEVELTDSIAGALYHKLKTQSGAVFLNCRAAARYRALVSIIAGRERFSWNLSF